MVASREAKRAVRECRVEADAILTAWWPGVLALAEGVKRERVGWLTARRIFWEALAEAGTTTAPDRR